MILEDGIYERIIDSTIMDDIELIKERVGQSQVNSIGSREITSSLPL